MKKNVLIFPRGTYRSTAAGAVRKYNHDSELFKLLGGATDVRVQAIVYLQSSANAQATIAFYEAAKGERPPSTYGHSVGTPMTITTTTPSPVTFSGPFLGNGELELAVDDVTSSGTESFDMEVWATAIYE